MNQGSTPLHDRFPWPRESRATEGRRKERAAEGEVEEYKPHPSPSLFRRFSCPLSCALLAFLPRPLASHVHRLVCMGFSSRPRFPSVSSTSCSCHLIPCLSSPVSPTTFHTRSLVLCLPLSVARVRRRLAHAISSPASTPVSRPSTVNLPLAFSTGVLCSVFSPFSLSPT